MISIWRVLFYTVLLLVAHQVLRSCIDLDVFAHLPYNHWPGHCVNLGNIKYGSEDVEYTSTGIGFITSGFIPLFPSAMYLVDMNVATPTLIQLKFESTFDKQNFHPHGLSLYETAKGVHVYVVNHHPNYEAVEQFEFVASTNTLRHIKTHRHAATMLYMNDLVVVGDGRFYFTNWYNTRDDKMQLLQTLVQIGTGSVVYYADGVGRELAAGLFIPNGIQLADNHLFVALSGSRALLSYELHDGTALKLKQFLELGLLVDNIDVHKETGDIWVAGQSVGHMALRGLFMHDPTPSPSFVLAIKQKGGVLGEVREVFSDDAQMTNTASVAARWKDNMLVGTVHNKLTWCKVLAY